MPLSSLHAILAALVAMNNREHHRIISETPSDEACAKGLGRRQNSHSSKEIFDGTKWIKYQCVEGKGTKIEYESVESEQVIARRRAQDEEAIQDRRHCSKCAQDEFVRKYGPGYDPKK